MILNYTQFALRIKEDDSRCIMIFQGHDALDHDTMRPCKRIGGGQNEKLSNQQCLDQLADFAKNYPDAYSCYFYSTSASIIQKGFFVKVDLRIKAEPPKEGAPAPQQPTVDREKLKEELRHEIDLEFTVVELTDSLKQEKAINLENQLISNKLASVGLEMLKQYGAGMNFGGAPMQGTEEETRTQDTAHTEENPNAMSIDEAMMFVQKELGDEFIINLAGKIKESNDKGEVPNLATKLKAML